HPPAATLFPYTTLFRSPPPDHPGLVVRHARGQEVRRPERLRVLVRSGAGRRRLHGAAAVAGRRAAESTATAAAAAAVVALRRRRSEEHTSELQSLAYLV